MEGLDLTGRGRHVLIPCQVVCGKRLRMRHMGVQCQQERWTFLHDAHPCMPVPVDASLVSFGFPKPTLQIVLSALWADFSRPSRAWLSATSPSNPQSRQCELYQGLVPIPVRSSVWRDTAAGTITPTLDLMQFVIDHAVTWVPHLPKHHLPATPRTTERITPRTGQHAITVSLLRHDAIRSLDQPTQCHHQHGEQPLHLLDFARGMQPIITNTMEPFRQNRLYHPPDEGQRRDLFLLPLLGLVIVVPVPHPLPVVAQDAPQGDRGTDDVFRQV